MIVAAAAQHELMKDGLGEVEKIPKEMTCPSCQSVHQAKVL